MLLIHILICHTTYIHTYQIHPIISLHGDIISNIIVPNSLLSSLGSRLCPGQLQKTTRSKETLSHSQGLDLETGTDETDMETDKTETGRGGACSRRGQGTGVGVNRDRVVILLSTKVPIFRF